MGSMLTIGSIFSIIVLIMAIVMFIAFIVIVVIAIKNMIHIFRKASQVTDAVKDVSKAVYGTENIAEGIKRQNFEASLTPRTISNMTSVYLPQIQKDFPEFHYEEMRERAKNVLTSYLYSIHEGTPSKLSEGSKELKDALVMHLHLLSDRNYEEHFERIKIHKCELSNYLKKDGRCTVTFQASIQYYHYIMEGNNIKTGYKDRLTQSKYEIQLVYIQDRDFIQNSDDSSLGLTCPNCAAPVTNLGAKHCIYCGTPIVEFNIHAWNFISVKEL